MFVADPLTDAALRGLILAALGLVWVALLIRTTGLRALSKMASFDFVVTVATGSLLAGAAQATDWTGFVQPCLAVAGLFAMQATVAAMRRTAAPVRLLLNQPLLVMRDGEVIDEALAVSRMSRADLTAKLREANALDMSEVRAVVLETTGDVSVLHGPTLQEELLDGVQDVSS